MSEWTLPLEIRSLPVAQRIDLMEQIWTSVVEEQQTFELTEAQQRELDRRIAAHRDDPGRGTPWEIVRKRLLGEE